MLFNKLNVEDRKLIDTYISLYGSSENSSTEPTAPLEYRLRFWNKNKRDLFKMFGENFILSKKVELIAEEDDLIEAMKKTLKRQYYYIEKYERFVASLYLGNFITSDQETFLFSLTNPTVLVKNIYNGDSFSFSYKDKKIQVQKGMKAIKLMQKVISLSDEDYYKDLFENFKLDHSLCLNQKKLEGTLCLSIHPLDYMTMSDNNSSWQSCMNWREVGEYRQGTVEMMNSPYVVVVYLKSNKDFYFDEDNNQLFWNNKKWRELFIVTDKIISEVKPYPYVNKTLTKYVLDWLKELKGNNLYRENYSNITYGYTDEETDSDIEFETKLMYNDFQDGYRYLAYLSSNNDLLGNIEICYSGETECLCCGELCNDRGSIFCEDIFCHKCNDRWQCPDCGTWLSPDADTYEYKGQEICMHCYDSYVFKSELTGAIYERENEEQIYLRSFNYLNEATYWDEISLAKSELKIAEELFGPITQVESGSYFSMISYVAEVQNFNLDKIRNAGLAKRALSFVEMIVKLKKKERYVSIDIV